jgi:flagellar hook-associated protein 2
MGTTSSTSSSSGTTSSGFTGSSSFSSDLQNVITRAVQIASLPMTQLQNEEGTLTSQQSELQTLGNDFQSLQTAFGSVDSAASSSLAASVDNSSVASASAGSGVLAGTYSVHISSLGAQTNTISNSTLPTVADPSSGNISTSSAFTLTVNGTDYSLTPASNNLNSLVAAINASGANVQATVVNVGGSTSPNYELSIQGTQYAPTTIQLNDGSQDLLSTLSPGGSYVTYQVNGQPSTPATSTSRTLDISTGLTVTALATGTANVTVAQNASGVENALTSLVTSYNAAVDEVTKNRGQNGGALAGQSVLDGLSSTLLTLANYSGSASGSIQNLTDIGLTFDQNGHLQFDASTFEAVAGTSLSNVMTFLGSVSGNTGFLGAANTALTSITDPTDGVIVQETNSLGKSITSLTSQISADQTYVNNLQTSITAQMAAADAAISSLQQQVSQITSLFTAEQDDAQSIANG